MLALTHLLRADCDIRLLNCRTDAKLIKKCLLIEPLLRLLGYTLGDQKYELEPTMKNGGEPASQKPLGPHSDATLLERTSDCRTGTNGLKINALEAGGEECSELSSVKDGEATMQSDSSDDELALIRRVAARDREAFEILYKRHAPGVCRYLSSQLRQLEIIEEALDDVMMVVWERASTFNGTSRLSTWILGIAHNKVLKARTRGGIGGEEYSESKHGQVETRGPEEFFENDELKKVMLRALDGLSSEQRAVIELTFYHDRSQAEIAEILGCPVNTVKTRMFHARQRLFTNESIKEWRPK